MDKLGHLTTSYYLGVAGIRSYRWSGMKEKNAIWFGGFTGSFFLSMIEYLDGKSAQGVLLQEIFIAILQAHY